MDEELREAARAYSEACDAWNATADAPPGERNWRSTAAYARVQGAKEELAKAGRRFAQSEG